MCMYLLYVTLECVFVVRVVDVVACKNVCFIVGACMCRYVVFSADIWSVRFCGCYWFFVCVCLMYLCVYVTLVYMFVSLVSVCVR